MLITETEGASLLVHNIEICCLESQGPGNARELYAALDDRWESFFINVTGVFKHGGQLYTAASDQWRSRHVWLPDNRPTE